MSSLPWRSPRAFLLLLAIGCGGDDTSNDSDNQTPDPDAGPAADAGDLPVVFGGDRPVTLQVPGDYDPTRAYPLLVILHGYTGIGAEQQAYFGFDGAADARDILVLAPDGTINGAGENFWNASDACCDLDASGVDDVAYLGGLIDDVAAAYNVDAARTFVIGHSNGGFMSFRLACERADVVAGIMSLAGAAAFADPEVCVPSEPVNILALHGNADVLVPYLGGFFLASFPGAAASIERWAGYNGCTGDLAAGADLDLDSVLLGSETATSATSGCPTGGAAELWTIRGGAHIPQVAQPGFADTVWSWLEAHPRP
jgi:polyhydroxybutyrate depolymerase